MTLLSSEFIVYKFTSQFTPHKIMIIIPVGESHVIVNSDTCRAILQMKLFSCFTQFAFFQFNSVYK
jgi:hypothetical protein